MEELIRRCEYPRPQLVRSEWMNLNGAWDFEIDNELSGEQKGFQYRDSLNQTIIVPFCPESKLSGIGNTDFMNGVWYLKYVEIPEEWQKDGRRIILNIDACDFETKVFVNGKFAGRHVGGYLGFSFDITDCLTKGKNKIVIYARDDVRSGVQPSGKQSLGYYSAGCFYTRTTGIWQTVWLECVPKAYIEKIKILTDAEAGSVTVDARCVNAEGKTITAKAFYKGTLAGFGEAKVSGYSGLVKIGLNEIHLWNVGEPELYDLKLYMGDDEVTSYFGLRSLSYEGGILRINGRKIFQRLILDQGFYPDGIYTAPDDSELKEDILRSLAFGFNGARLHQKVFEPRFLTYCDILGYIVWGEYPNWGMSYTDPKAWLNLADEWISELERDFNHPAIIGWCPLNETVPPQDEDAMKMLYRLTKLYDDTRPVIDTSGYTHVITDVVDIHNYEQNAARLKNYLENDMKNTDQRLLDNVNGFRGIPTFVSEYGGIWWNDVDDGKSFGYGDKSKSLDEVIERYRSLTDAILDCPDISAFCYTQLTDVEQEQNGLYTYDRRAKLDPDIIKKINTRKAACEDGSDN